jgi:hypothetical protein
MRPLLRSCYVASIAIGMLGLVVSGAAARQATEPQPVEIPTTATVLEGLPAVRVDADAGGDAARQLLSESEAEQSRLTVGLVDDEYYWTSRENRPLQKFTLGAYTYLSSDPGHYIRFTRLNDRIAYEEHVDSEFGSTTWWGELRIVIGK